MYSSSMKKSNDLCVDKLFKIHLYNNYTYVNTYCTAVFMNYLKITFMFMDIKPKKQCFGEKRGR